AVVVSGYVTVYVVGDSGNSPEEDVFGESHIATGANIRTVEASVGGLDRSGIFAFRFLRVELDRAADRVLSGQRALRTAEHLNAVEIEQVQYRSGQRRVVDIIDIQPNAGLEGVIEIALTYAADEGLQSWPVGRRSRLQHHIRCFIRHIDDRRLVASFQHVRVDRRDGERRVLDALLTKLRRHDDLLERVVGWRGRLLGPTQRRQHADEERGETDRTSCQQHASPPAPDLVLGVGSSTSSLAEIPRYGI